MIVDFHTHIFPPNIRDRRASYLGRDPCFDAIYTNPKARIASAEDLVASMDAEGIDVSVACNIGWASHELCVETNDYIMETVARYPGRFVGFCALQPLAGEKALLELERCIRGGLKGIGELRCDTQGFDMADKETMAPLAQMCVDHNLVFLTHTSEPVGHSYPGKGTITPDVLFRFIQSFPDLTIVCAHWGGGLPFYALMPEVAAALSNVHFDTAASPFLYADRVFEVASGLIGPERILFGSDHPLITQERIIKSIRKLDLSEESKNMILGGNARRILSLE